MYKKILAALDGSYWSNLAIQATLELAQKDPEVTLIGCHVYAAELHRTRFEEMEPGLPEQYQEEEKLSGLRETHEDLITDGLALISDSYLAPLVKQAKEKGFSVSGLTPEGHNHVRLLDQIREQSPDLTILGAQGHGFVPESRIGSLTERVLLADHNSDMLIMRQPLAFKGKPIVVGIDGSQASYAALQRAIELGKLFDAKIEALAIYDPFFHVSVFRVIADALPESDQQRFNFPAQEKLHDEIIDKGLEKLYRDGLERAGLLAEQQGVSIKMEVLAGKVYPQLYHYAQTKNAGLIIMGKYGLHHEPQSLIGSNTHQLSRLCDTNLLVVQSPQNPIDIPELVEETNDIEITWTAEAEQRMKRIPAFVRKMARRSIESRAREQGRTVIDEDFVATIAARMGRG